MDYLHDWANLLLRWGHLIVGVAWIGASFYFNWLENHLERQNASLGDGVAGELWAPARASALVQVGGLHHLSDRLCTAVGGLLPERGYHAAATGLGAGTLAGRTGGAGGDLRYLVRL